MEMNVVFFFFALWIRRIAVSDFRESMIVVDDGKPTSAIAAWRGKREEEPHRSRLHGKGAAVG